MTRVLVFGTFDRLHPGHRYVFEQASKRGDLFVIVARDTSVQTIKQKTPVQSEDIRLQAVQAAVPHANVRLGDTEDYLKPVREIEPDLILLGYDQKLPPGVRDEDLPGTVERLEPFQPDIYKSSLLPN